MSGKGFPHFLGLDRKLSQCKTSIRSRQERGIKMIIKRECVFYIVRVQFPSHPASLSSLCCCLGQHNKSRSASFCQFNPAICHTQCLQSHPSFKYSNYCVVLAISYERRIELFHKMSEGNVFSNCNLIII